MPQPTTGILYDDLFLEHDEPTHPENADRLRAITALLDRTGIWDELLRIPIVSATEQQVGAVHRSYLLEHLQMVVYEGGGWLNPDTYLTADSWNVALRSAGAAICATEAVIRSDVANAFALVRPPGHHATPRKAMGFCLVNNVAVAAQYALDVLGLQRIAIVDWDTHHGNGTQDCFYENGKVLYCSSHTWGIFPGTGDWREMGEGAGVGTTLNVPMLPYADDDAFDRVYDEAIIPAVARFAPDLIIVSAGYDSHWADPLAPMNASVAGYARLAEKVYNLAADVCSGRVVCVLEGGYNLQALASGVLATLRVLQGRPDLVQDPLGARSGSRQDVGSVIDSLRRLHPLLA